MLDVGFVAALTLIAAGAGRLLLRTTVRNAGLGVESLGLYVTAGLGMIALTSLVAGQLIPWNRPALAAVLIAFGGVGASQVLTSWRTAPRSSVLGAGRAACTYVLGSMHGGSGRILVGAYALALAATFVTALAPVTDGDALCYHLLVPSVFLREGALGFDPDLHETIYPLLVEFLYGDALAFRGPVACRLIQWVLGLSLFLQVVALARPSLGPRAWWAGLIALLVPAVSNGMTAPLNDVALATFGTASILLWSRYLERPTTTTAALTGILAGMACGVKYPALVLAGLLGLTMAWPRRDISADPLFARLGLRLSRSLRHAAAYTACLTLFGAAWYLRSAFYTGNPVYPFFRDVFGGAGLDEVLDPIKRPLGPGTLNLLCALVPMTLDPNRFDSVSHQFGPVFLLFLPALWLERPPRRVLAVVLLGYAFLTLCLTQRQSMRFVLTVVGPFSLGVAWLAARWWDRRSVAGRCLVVLLGITLGFELGIATARAKNGVRVALGLESDASYLMTREPTYRVGRWVDEHLPPQARLIGQDHRGFYIPRPYTMELAHRRRTGLGRRQEGADEIIARLSDRGFTHVLLCPPEPENAVEFDPELGRLLAPWLRTRSPIYEERIVDGDGIARRYSIYALQPQLAFRDRSPPE